MMQMRGFRAQARHAALIFLAICAVTAGTASPIRALPTATSPCTRGQTHAAFNSFIASFNQGDFAKLRSLFAEEPDFQWFSSPHPGRRLGAEAKNRDTLIPYFRRRHARDEEFRLLAFNFAGNARRWSNFHFEAIRRADGFNDGKWRGMPGKGAAVCEQGSPQIIVLSLGGSVPGG